MPATIPGKVTGQLAREDFTCCQCQKRNIYLLLLMLMLRALGGSCSVVDFVVVSIEFLNEPLDEARVSVHERK
jgi:hypothetical protein